MSGRQLATPVLIPFRGDELWPYKHRELKPQFSIRLVRLLLSKPKVVCELREHNLKDQTFKFDALSWTWGSDPWDEWIIIGQGGEHFYHKEPRNLVLALEALPYLHQTIWVDALCIDRQNVLEKSQQIPIMPKIYGSARRVIVWLGGPTEESNIAIDFLRYDIHQWR